MVTQQDAQLIKQHVESGSTQFAAAVSIWRAEAEKALKQGPWPVTSHHPPIKISPNDYYSEAPYYWPGPGDPARYVRRDGQRNPKRFQDDHHDLAFRDWRGWRYHRGELLSEYEKFQPPHDSWSQWIWAITAQTKLPASARHRN
ncbi:MAG TPA: hypothetical protein VG168_04820 [Bryobacteraceae bacterium]|jgi:hypothetical protein|nr:hypothetical protein [Bryobacteraceae bacterium]